TRRDHNAAGLHVSATSVAVAVAPGPLQIKRFTRTVSSIEPFASSTWSRPSLLAIISRTAKSTLACDDRNAMPAITQANGSSEIVRTARTRYRHQRERFGGVEEVGAVVLKTKSRWKSERARCARPDHTPDRDETARAACARAHRRHNPARDEC